MKRITILLICLVLGTACLTGCANNDEAFIYKSYTADTEQITGVSLDVRDRQIEVALSADEQIHISYWESSKEYYNISVTDDHTLTMAAVSDKEWSDYIGGKAATSSRKISLQVPDALLSQLMLSTTNEDIIVPELTVADDILLSTNSGSLKFDSLNAGTSISLTTKNGDIIGSIGGSYDDYAISCDIKKGKSNLPPSKENGVKTLTISNNNGDTNIEFISVPHFLG